MAHQHGVPLIVDNTVASPILLRPIEFGADIVVQSLTKFMGGHGTTLGGAIVDSGKFLEAAGGVSDVQPAGPPRITGWCIRTISAVRLYRALPQCLYANGGAVLSPMSAFLLLQGIETVALRMERHVENGRAVAEFLRGDPRVEWVNYAGFAENPYHALAAKYLAGRGPR